VIRFENEYERLNQLVDELVEYIVETISDNDLGFVNSILRKYGEEEIVDA
jgi:uncharacterized membrane protein YvbJ